ncbi:hypothetical protein [Brevibacterium aurantiacum]|uniref:Uncharacterized protein n=1 Tax=Brevibacterium aurantiacum TaxID=273384 RepID=A0A2H1HIG5_BREAU|nr:hypothetical protein [Brevibacterium aurantiacum]SMX62656.1 hypothetical protein BAUR9175_00080 [Brevibacterium aurantiacum]
MRRAQQLVSDTIGLGALTIPVWVLWVAAVVVVCIIVTTIIVRINRRARKIARASSEAGQTGAENGRAPGFGFYGAVTSAISITPDVKSKSRRGEDPKSGE